VAVNADQGIRRHQQITLCDIPPLLRLHAALERLRIPQFRIVFRAQQERSWRLWIRTTPADRLVISGAWIVVRVGCPQQDALVSYVENHSGRKMVD
jgi:hypothetical protein